jgi:hypothetical protein
MKAIRIMAIVLVGLTAVVNVLGGAGTSCAAFAPERWDAMKPLASLQWLYQMLVFTVVGAGVAGAWTTYTLARARKNAYATALAILIASIVLALVQMIASRALRGKSMPTDLRLYVSAITLLALLALRLPGVWEKAGMGGAGGSASGGNWQTPTGLASILMGAVVLTTPLWASESHFLDGYNWVNVWRTELLLSGLALLVGGGWVLALRRALPNHRNALHQQAGFVSWAGRE